MPVPSQRQPRHPHSLIQFRAPRRFELVFHKPPDFSGSELIGQYFHGIVGSIPTKVREATFIQA